MSDFLQHAAHVAVDYVEGFCQLPPSDPWQPGGFPDRRRITDKRQLDTELEHVLYLAKHAPVAVAVSHACEALKTLIGTASAEDLIEPVTRMKAAILEREKELPHWRPPAQKPRGHQNGDVWFRALSGESRKIIPAGFFADWLLGNRGRFWFADNAGKHKGECLALTDGDRFVLFLPDG